MELVAGKTRGSVVAALFQNGDVLEDAYESAAKASGSAMKELDTYLNSIDGKLDKFNNSVQTLWMNLIDSEVVKGFVYIGTWLVNIADKVGIVRLAFMALTTVFMRKNGITSLGEFFKAGAISAEEATKKLEELKVKYAELDGLKSQKNLRQQDNIAKQMKPYEAIVEGAEKAKVAQGNLAKSQDKLKAAQDKLTHAQENGFPTDTIKSYQVLVDEASKEVANATKEVQRLELANQQLGNSALIGWGKLKAGAAALWVSLKSIGKQLLEMYTMTAIIDIVSWGVEALVNWIDDCNETVEESQEKLDELKNELASIESEIDRLNSELDTTNDTIEELMDKGTLSFAEEEELDRLKSISAELEKQVQFQETLKEAKAKAVNAQAIATTSKYLNETSFGSDKSKTERQDEAEEESSKLWGAIGFLAAAVAAAGITVATAGAGAPVGATILAAGSSAATWGGIGYFAGTTFGGMAGSDAEGDKYDAEQNVADAIASMKETREKFNAEIQQALNEGDVVTYNAATEALSNYDAKMAEHMSVIAQNANAFNWEVATDEEKEQMREMLNILDAYNITMGSKDAKVNAIDRLFGEDADEVVKAYKNKIKNDIENGKAVDFQEMIDVTGLRDDLDALGIETKDVADYFTKLGEAGADAIEKMDFSDVISELAAIEGVLDSFKSVMEEFQEEGIVSASTLAGLDDNIKNLDAFDAYAEALMSRTASLADVNRTTEDLIKEFLDKNADNITNGNKLTYVAQLEAMGVKNASELVDSYINNSFWNSTAFDNFKGGYEELIKLAEEYGIVLDENTAKEIVEAKEAYKAKEAMRNQQVTAHETAKYQQQKQQQEAIDKLGDTRFRDDYDMIVNMMNRTGVFSNFSEDAVQTLLDAKLAEFKAGLTAILGDETDDLWNKLFPDTSLIPEITVSQAEVDKYKKELQELCDKMGISVPVDLNFNTNNALEETADVEDAFAALKDVYDEFTEHNIVSAKSLVGLQEAFGKVEGFEAFVNTLGNSTATIEDVRQAIQGLANGFLNDFDYSTLLDANGNIIESEARRVAAQLENIGVENANELVRQKAWAYNQAKTIYGIDLNNYESAEEAKNDYLLQTVINQIEVTGKGMIDGFAEQYKKDLENYGDSWEEKIRCAKESAQKILEANKASEISSLNTEFEDRMGYTQGGAEVGMLEQWYERELARIKAKYNEAASSLSNIDEIPNMDTSGIFTYYDPTTITPEKFGGNGSDSATELDWLDHYFTEIENKIKEGEARLENVMSADVDGLSEKNTIIDEIIGLYESKKSLLETAKNAYLDRADDLLRGFDSDIQAKIANGSIDIKEYDDETADNIQKYFDYITTANDLEIEWKGVKVTIADLSLQNFNDTAEAFDNEIEEKFQSDQDLLEAEIGYLEEQGKRVDPKLYQKLIDIQRAEQAELENKKKTLEDILATEVAAGRIAEGDEQWYEMKAAINDVDEAIIQSKNDIESWQNSINETYWNNFDKLIDQIDAVNSELSHLFDLLSEDDKVVDEFGNWTDEGIASLGLLAQQMENAQAKANEYAEAIKQLDEDYANGKYSQDEYNKKMAELKDSYLSEIKNIEDLKDEMVNLNKVRIEAIKKGIDKEIEALEEKNEKIKESLDLEKEQYEWQKSVAEKEKSIADIQRRLNALAGDNSASAIAERRKLQAELAQAQQEMDDMWYEHSIEEQQKSLDESLGNYKENKEDEKEALDKWLEDEEKVIQESFDLFNSNVDLVSSVLTAFEQEHGIELTKAITDPWKSGIDAMTAYRDELAKMKQEQDDTKQDAKDAADDIIESLDKPEVTTPTTAPTDAPKPNDTPKPDDKPKSPSVGETVTVRKGTTNWSRDGGNGTRMSSWVPGSSFTVSRKDGDEVLLSRNGVAVGWINQNKLEGYYKGTTGVKDDQWAFTDELGPELTLHAGPNGRLQYLTKGSGVVTADLTKRLMEWGELDPSQVLKNSAPKLGAPHITTNNMEINLQINEVVHIDHADSNSIQDITSAVQKQMDQYMKNVNQSLKRFAR